MAYDKVIDSAQLEAAITASANAIREKTGDTALIQWLADKGFAEAIAGIESGGGGSTLWNGGKFTMGSFVLAEETTSEYVIATNADSAMLDLLNDGESLTDQEVYGSIGLIVVVRPKGVSVEIETKKSVMYIGLNAPVHFGSGSSAASLYGYWDLYGSNKAAGSNSVGAMRTHEKLSVCFAASAKGSPNFEYLWLAWRGVR